MKKGTTIKKKYKPNPKKIGVRLSCEKFNLVLENGLSQAKLKAIFEVYGEKFVSYE